MNQEMDPKLYESYETVEERTLGEFEKEELKSRPVYKGKTIDELTTHDKLELANTAYRDLEKRLIDVFNQFKSVQEQYTQAKKYKNALEAEVNKEVTTVMKGIAKGVAETMIDIQKQSATTTDGLKFEKEDEAKT